MSIEPKGVLFNDFGDNSVQYVMSPSCTCLSWFETEHERIQTLIVGSSPRTLRTYFSTSLVHENSGSEAAISRQTILEKKKYH